MGLFDMFGGSKHPPLDPGSPEARVVVAHESQIADLVAQVGGSIEVVTADGAAFAFIGNPPKAFGIAWFDGDEVHNLKKYAEAKGLGYGAIAPVTDRLGAAYSTHAGAPRFSHAVGKHKVVVISSDELGREVAAIIGAL